MKMTKEIFEARLLQIQLERDALNAEIMSMAGEDADRTRQGYALAWGPAMFSDVADALRALQGDLKKLMDEYQEGVASPAPRLYTLAEVELVFDEGIQQGQGSVRCLSFHDLLKTLEGAGK